MCVCIVGVVLGWGCVVLTDATIVCHSCVCVLWVWYFVCHSCVCVCIVGVVLGRGCVVLTDATIVCHSCVCVYCGCGTWAGMCSIN